MEKKPPETMGILQCWDRKISGHDGWRFPRNVALFLEGRYGNDCIHFFGGRATFGIRLDLDPLVQPDVLGDAWAPPFRRDSRRAVILDPPYEYVNSQMLCALLARAAWVAREEVVWLSTLWIEAPIPELRLKLARIVLLRRRSAGVRAMEIFQVDPRLKRPPYDEITRGPGVRYNRWAAGRQLPLPRAMEVKS